MSSDGRTLSVVTADGRAVVVNAAARQVTRTAQLQLPADRWVLHGSSILSSEGSRLYIGLGQLGERGQPKAREIFVIDTNTWQRLGSMITTSQPFWTLLVSQDGNRLYALNPSGQSLLTIDTTTYQEVGVIGGLGETPALGVLAP